MSPAPTNTTDPPPDPPVTVTADVPLLVSEVAVIVAEPAACPLTRPFPSTVATLVLLLPQVTTRPVRMLLLASFRVAVSCTVAPTATVAGFGFTVTVETGGGGAAVTVRDDVPLLVSLVGVIVAVPAAFPLARPVPSTVATPVWLLDQV